jgi:aspartate beta-hydroxylase
MIRPMPTPSADVRALLQSAAESLGRRDESGALAAVDRVLAIEPRNLRALILKADCFAAQGDARAASAFYLAAVKAAPPPPELAPDVRKEVGRAQAMCERYAAQLERAVREAVAGANGASDRFAQSLDLIFGRRQIYLQQPRFYYFPELAQIQFFDRDAFAWLVALEAAVPEIRAELTEVLKSQGDFRPYVQGDPKRPRKAQDGMADNPDWSAFYLWKDGSPIAANAARCPKTMQALERVPLARVSGRSPSALFSLLRPGAHIPPHNGFVNTRLICHLPLVVPGECRFRVGNEVREWVEGRAWIFDDTIEHEAWNDSREPRVVLLFEIWRPELTAQERGLVSAMFEAIDAQGGDQPAWQI